jgi:hypothetical protein
MKWYEYVLVIGLLIGLTIAGMVIVTAVEGFVANDSRHIRTFDNCHTIMWNDTLWRLEKVELGKTSVKVDTSYSYYPQQDADSIIATKLYIPKP